VNHELPEIACVGNSSEQLADCAVRLHSDPLLWGRLRNEALKFVARTHDRSDVKHGLRRAVEASLSKPCLQHVVLHAGLHKTGTSYIQNQLAYNQELLRSQRLLYPRTKWKSHHFLAGDRWLDPSNKNTSDAAQEISSFWRQLESCDASSVVVSSEQFSILSEALLDSIAAQLQPRRMRAVLFYRNLHGYTKSMYLQQLRGLEYRGAFADYLQATADGDGMRSKVLSAVIRLQHGLGRLEIIDFAGARAQGDIADALLEVAGLRAHFLRDHPNAAHTASQHTSLGDEPHRRLIPHMASHARDAHACKLTWDFLSLFGVSTASALPLLARHPAPLMCVNLTSLSRQALMFDDELRASYGDLFIKRFASRAATRREIHTMPLHYCDVDDAKVLGNATWQQRFDEQLRALPSWMTCDAVGERRTLKH
jgi:hypothetical protein